MALLFLDGFDKYGPANSNSTAVAALLTAGEWTSASAPSAIVSGLSATGYALTLNGAAAVLSKTLAGNYGRLIGGVRFSLPLTFTTGIEFIDSATVQASIQFNTTGTFSVRNGAYTTGTILSTSSASVTANSTHYLEFDITFGNVGTGAYQVWLDGVSIISGTGDTTATANNFANIIRFQTAGASANLIIDDLYLFDNTGTTNNAVLLTSPRIETQFPTGDGAVQFAVGAGILGTNVQRSTVSNPLAGSLILRRFVPGVNCTLASISIVASTASGASQWRGVVYADSSGVPGALMSSGSTVTGVAANTPQALPLTTPQALTAGTPYWLGYMNDTSVNMQLVDGDSQNVRVAATFASGAPSTAPAMTAGQASVLMWGNLSVVSANWWQVSRQPTAGANSYNYEATVGEEDLYTYPALSVPPSAIYAVAVKASVAKSDAGAKTVSVRMKSGATDSAGTGGTQAPGTSYGWLTSHYPTDPATSAAWTLSALNAAQAGVKVES